MDCFVIGISGGIDSALVSTLCAQTGKRTIVVSMPIHQQSDQLERAYNHIKCLKEKYPNVESHTKDLSVLFDYFKGLFGTPEHKLALANSRSRLRMVTLYQMAGMNKGLVVGTGNKVEDFGVGFFTKYGDGGVDLSPIADLTKTQVFKVAKAVDVIDDILIAKPLTPKNFFTCGGLAISYVSNNELGNTEVSDCDISTIAAAKNARKIIYHKYKYFFSRRIKHIFHSQIKSLAEEIEINNINSLNEMRFNKFRKNNDILFSSFLCPYIGYIKGKYIFKNNIKYHYIKIRNIQSKNTYEEIVKKNKLVREVICINDTLNVDFVLDNYEKYLEEFLIKLYPIPSQLEKT
jgi:NH3-dependent NAD+ synthetase